tara:strand:+ start:336 stop:497 length:162 start_codon:yes stop_codon:yes gene_type:complete
LLETSFENATLANASVAMPPPAVRLLIWDHPDIENEAGSAGAAGTVSYPTAVA